jgi:hypothetical protein
MTLVDIEVFEPVSAFCIDFEVGAKMLGHIWKNRKMKAGWIC